MPREKLVEPDSRGRVSLGEFGQHSYYLMSVDEDSGDILLRAVVPVPLADTLDSRKQPR